MNRAEYSAKLQALSPSEWTAYLLSESGLPGARANLTLIDAAADVGDETQFRAWLHNTHEKVTANSAEVFPILCGIVGYGRLLAEGQLNALAILRKYASDMRWRVREAVCIGLQRVGDAHMDALLNYMADWSTGNLLEKRAAAAALCEPRLLKNPAQVEQVLTILDSITTAIPYVKDRKAEDFQALRKGLGYCWSVAVCALPDMGKRLMEKWFANTDKDIRWIMRENLRKDRLKRMDAAWVSMWSDRL